MTVSSSVPSRLSAAENDPDLAPWRKAKSLTKCHLYWLAAEFPLGAAQRTWQLAFFRMFSEKLEAELGVAAQLFLQMKCLVPKLSDLFIKTSIEFNPFFGLSRRPEAPIPPLPDMNYVEDLQKGVSKYEFGDRMPEYCYWFVKRQLEKQRETFLGFGGLTTLFIKPDPSLRPPPPPAIPPGARRSPYFAALLKEWKPEQSMQIGQALQSSFLKKSKDLFGVGLEEDSQYPGLLYILPLLGSKDFFQQSEEYLSRSFEIFDVYVNESSADHGVVLAFQTDYEPLLVDVLRTMREQNLWYPGQQNTEAAR